MYYPLRSLREGHWFKLICGASFQHLPAVRNLALAYTLVGADCIDVAADPAVIASVQEALKAATNLAAAAQKRGFGLRGLPWLMVSLNDGEDPHFRKAAFNQQECPQDCHRPCENVCPTQAIVPYLQTEDSSGVVQERCYGCGRCVPICPHQLIHTSLYVSTPGAIAPLVLSTGVDAVEIHTQVGRSADFKRLWTSIAPWVDQLKLLAISCPDGDGLIDYLWSLYDLISPLPCPLVWQTDGRPMSGDIGDGTTLAAIKLGQKVLAAGLPGYVQLAGGTNSYTVTKLREIGLLERKGDGEMGRWGDGERGKIPPHPLTPSPPHPLHVSGVAYGSYARVLLSPILDQLEQMQMNKASVTATVRLEEQPELLWQAVALANSLVSQLKPSPQYSPVRS